MKKMTLLLLAAGVVVAGTYLCAAGQPGANATDQIATRACSSSPICLTMASAAADRAVEDETDSTVNKNLNLFFADGEAHGLGADTGFEILIKELLDSGDLTEAGAVKLRESLRENHYFGLHAPLQFVPRLGEDGEPLDQYFGLGLAENGTGLFDFSFSGDDDGRKLEISIGDDGEVEVEGEGYSDEELAEIREKIQKQHAEGGPLMLFDGPMQGHVMKWSQQDGEHPFFFRNGEEGNMPFGVGGSWMNEDGNFDLKEFQKQFPGGGAFQWKQEDGAALPHMFMFQDGDGPLREQVERMVREILDEMGVDYNGNENVNTTSC